MRKYTKMLPVAFLMTWLTVDIMSNGGFIEASGDVWKLVLYTWALFFLGISTHYFWVEAKENCELEDDSLENSRGDTK